jgi:hypothetical protein
MRFLMKLIYSERNDKILSENSYDIFLTIPCIELGLRQAAGSPPRHSQYRDRKQTVVVQKCQDDSPRFSLWIVFLCHNQWIARCRDNTLVCFFKYCAITAINHGLQNKIISTKASLSQDIAKGVEKSEN